MRERPEAPRVVAVTRVDLAFREAGWDFAEARRDEIARHWARRVAENPRFFNGRILMLADGRLADGGFSGTLMPVDFAAFLYWRDAGQPDRSVCDAFGSAVLRSAEGHVLLGRQAAGGLNAGNAYFPGGFLDLRDVAADGRVDVDASVARELAEETGLDVRRLVRRPGYHLTCFGAQMSFGIEYRAAVGADALARAVAVGMARDPDAELSGTLLVRDAAEAADPSIPGYAQVLLRHLLAGTGPAA